MTEVSGDILTPRPGVAIKAQKPERATWTTRLANTFRNPFDRGTVPHNSPPVVSEERTAQQPSSNLAERITALSQLPSETIGLDVIAGKSVRADQLEAAETARNKANLERVKRLEDALKADRLNGESTTEIPEAPVPLGSNVRMAQLGEARDARMQPIEQSEPVIEIPNIIKPTAQPTAESMAPVEATSTVTDAEPEPLKPVFSQALMDSMVPRSPLSGKTYAEIEQEKAKANADAAIARAKESKVDEVVDSATIKPEKPGIRERAGTFREGIGRRSARIQEAITSTGILPTAEERAERAAVQATLKKVAVGTVEPLSVTTDTAAGITPEERRKRFIKTIETSYDRKGVTEPSVDTMITDAQSITADKTVEPANQDTPEVTN